MRYFRNKYLLYLWFYSFWSRHLRSCGNRGIVLLAQAENLVDFAILLSAYSLDNAVVELPFVQLDSLAPLLDLHRLGTRLSSLFKLPFFRFTGIDLDI